MAYATDNVSVEDPSGYIRVYLVTGGTQSGKPMEKHFCGNCGCTLWTVPMRLDGKVHMVRTSLIENACVPLPETSSTEGEN
jgi:hypothetical protein